MFKDFLTKILEQHNRDVSVVLKRCSIPSEYDYLNKANIIFFKKYDEIIDEHHRNGVVAMKHYVEEQYELGKKLFNEAFGEVAECEELYQAARKFLYERFQARNKMIDLIYESKIKIIVREFQEKTNKL